MKGAGAMNRFKKYLRNNLNIKLANDYPWLPYETKYNLTLEDIFVSAERCTITYFYNVGDFQQRIERDGSITNLG